MTILETSYPKSIRAENGKISKLKADISTLRTLYDIQIFVLSYKHFEFEFEISKRCRFTI